MNFIEFLDNLDAIAKQNGGSYRARHNKLLNAESHDSGNFYTCDIENSLFIVRIILNTKCEIEKFSIDYDEKTGCMNTIVKYPNTNLEVYSVLKDAIDKKTKFYFDLEDVNIGGIPLNKKVIFKFTIEDEEGSKFNEGDVLEVINYDHDQNKIYFIDSFEKKHSFVMTDAIHFWKAIFSVMN
jgi:hypothetical protein